MFLKCLEQSAYFSLMDTTRETISDENGSGEDVNEKDGKDG
jgi:hypothetical protein